MNVGETYLITERIVRETAPTITQMFRTGVTESGLKRVSGKSRRAFASSIKRDRSTGEIWGVSFAASRYVYMHHHGMELQDVVRNGVTYRSKGYDKKGLLTKPAVEGAKLLADKLSAAQADYMVTGISGGFTFE